MKKTKYLFSFGFHIILFFFAYFFIQFKVKDNLITLGYKNVEFSIIQKDKTEFSETEKEKFVMKNEGLGETIARSKENQNIPKLKESTASSFLKAKFKLDFRGERKRSVYSYILPEYPEGVEKNINIVLQITIEPDGSVSNVFPLIKADTKLEIAAIDAVEEWRFEPLPKQVKQISQDAIIIFPYRLR